MTQSALRLKPLVEYLENARAANLAVSGHALVAKAKTLASELNELAFTCNNGWLE